MGFAAAIRSCLAKYADFRGRACRAEYWWFTLFDFLIGSAAAVIDANADQTLLAPLLNLALLLPGLAVAARRLHDVGRSGWWLLLGLIPLIGWLVLLIWTIRRGDSTPNRYGDSPLPA